MPLKVQSSSKITSTKSHYSHPNLTAHSIISNPYSPPQHYPSQNTITSQNNNHHNHSRSKPNLLVKKRPLGLSRNNTSLILNKPATSSHQRKTPNPTQRRPAKRGAFKGALDPDLADQDEQQDLLQPSHPTVPNKSQREDEAWVSEPSTRSATPIPYHPSQDSHLNAQLDSPKPQLGLQLPNPLSSNSTLPLLSSSTSPSSTSQLFIQPSTSPPPPAETSTPTTNQAQLLSKNPDANLPSHLSPNRNQDPLPEPLEHPSVIQPQESAQCLGRHPSPTLASQANDPSTDSQNAENQLPPPSSLPSSPRCSSPLRGKGKTPSTSDQRPRSIQRASINSARSFSSLAIFHNDLLISQNNRQGLKRVDSVGSVVLPPKVDTTEAVIALNGKGTFHPTLNAISDIPSEISEPRSNPPLCSTESPNSKPSLRAPSERPESAVHSKQAQPLPSGSKTPSTITEQSECTRRLKRYSNSNGQAHYINLKAANDFSSGLMSSLLSPQLTFKSRRAQTPGPQTHLGNSSGYFDSFKNFVGMSAPAEEPTKDNVSLGKQDMSNQASVPQPPQAYAQSLKNATSNVVLSSSLSRDNKNVTHQNPHQRHPFVHPQQLHGGPANLTNPKPVVPGFITTCGPVPVVSKFLGPRPVISSNTLETTPSSNVGAGWTQGQNDEGLGKSESLTNSSLHTPTKLGSQNGSPNPTRVSGTDSTSLSRIQKKLLMERDRPISPTLFEELNHPKTDVNINNQPFDPKSKTAASSSSVVGGGQLGTGGNSGGSLPPPSYLIRSLGGQTGPLPFIPLNLLPSAQITSKISEGNNQSNILMGSIKGINNTSDENKNTASGTPHHHLQKDTNLIITPSTPVSTNTTPQAQQQQATNWLNLSSSDVGNVGSRLNEPALKAKQALSIKLWRNSLIDEVEQILTDHESNTRFRNPLIESLQRVSNSNLSFSSM